MVGLYSALLSYMFAVGHVCLLVQSHDTVTLPRVPLGEATRHQKNHQALHGSGDASFQEEISTEVFQPEKDIEFTRDLVEGRNLEISPSFYHTMFGTSLQSLQDSMLLLYTTNTSTIEGLYGRKGHLISLAVSSLAALGSGIAAIISVILVPLRVANQILAIIALALLAAYIIEDKHALKYLAGSDHHFQQDTIYSSSYGYNGVNSLYRNDLLDEEGDDNEPSLREEVMMKEVETEEKEEEEEGNTTFSGYNANANSIRDLLTERNRIDEAEKEIDFAFRKYPSQYDQTSN